MRSYTLAIGLLVMALPGSAVAKRMLRPSMPVPPTFQLTGKPIGGAKPATETAAFLTGSRIMATADGALVIDADSGALIKTNGAGMHVDELAIGRDAGLLTYDATARRAYIADRHGDRIVVVQIGARLQITSSWKTPVEPYAVALTPDRKMLLVATIADRTLVAIETETGTEAWRTALGSEPRGLAVSPDGKSALVSYLATGNVDQIELSAKHRLEHIRIANVPPLGRRSTSFVRGSFAVTYLGDGQAVVPFQRETPVQEKGDTERTGSYGGGAEPPVQHQLAFLGFAGGHTRQATAQIAPHQVRALAWDRVHDALYVAGLGSDTILQLKDASQSTIDAGLTAQLTIGSERCGPDGLAIEASGDVLVWCAFTRSVQRLEFVEPRGALASRAPIPAAGPTLIASAWNETQHQGLVLFHAADRQISARGALACATCHPDGRADGLSWRIDKHELQTPVLAGRVPGTHPFKWDGSDATLVDSLTGTMKRLGGFGIDATKTAALAAYVEALPAVRAPSREPLAVAAGRKLFDGEAGCRTCHDGAAYTDQERHRFVGTLTESDTPSLLGLAASAPYFHDGSATTLVDVLRDRGKVHGMADTTKLSAKQVAELTAFLETL